MSLPIRWRLTLFNALVIGAILLALGFSLYLLLREALLSNVEDTARGRAVAAANVLESGGDILGEDAEHLTADGVFLVARDARGGGGGGRAPGGGPGPPWGLGGGGGPPPGGAPSFSPGGPPPPSRPPF